MFFGVGLLGCSLYFNIWVFVLGGGILIDKVVGFLGMMWVSIVLMWDVVLIFIGMVVMKVFGCWLLIVFDIYLFVFFFIDIIVLWVE